MVKIHGYKKSHDKDYDLWLVKSYEKGKETHIIQTRDYDLYQKVLMECNEAEDMEEILEVKKKYCRWSPREDRYIYYQGKSWVILKDKTYYGRYDNIEEARKYKKIFEENEWNKDLIPYRRKRWKKGKWNNKTRGEKYIYYTTSDKFAIIKNAVYYGTFNTLPEAILERDLLIKYDWNYEEMIESEGTIHI